MPIPLRATNIKRKETNFFFFLFFFYFNISLRKSFFSYLYSSYKYIVSLKWKLSFLLEKKNLLHMWRTENWRDFPENVPSSSFLYTCTSMPAYSILSHHKPYVSILLFVTRKISFPVDGFRFIFIMPWYTQFHATCMYISPDSPTLNVLKYSQNFIFSLFWFLLPVYMECCATFIHLYEFCHSFINWQYVKDWKYVSFYISTQLQKDQFRRS